MHGLNEILKDNLSQIEKFEMEKADAEVTEDVIKEAENAEKKLTKRERNYRR